VGIISALTCPQAGQVTVDSVLITLGPNAPSSGRPAGISGEEVEKYYRDGHIRDIAAYCESDVVNTYRVWLRYELFRGRLSNDKFQASEACLIDFMKARGSPS
jgi:predicted PolB exonuclease-like 3'-5' exonuclease